MTRKEELKKLARDIKFESKMFADEFGHSNKEPLRYYLWMCELAKWLVNNQNTGVHFDIAQSDETLEYQLISNINYINKYGNS